MTICPRFYFFFCRSQDASDYDQRWGLEKYRGKRYTCSVDFMRRGWMIGVKDAGITTPHNNTNIEQVG